MPIVGLMPGGPSASLLPGLGAYLAAPGSPHPKLNEPMLGGPLSQGRLGNPEILLSQ